MKIHELAAPITASKSDWLAGTNWIGFTPTDGDLASRNKCQSTIRRQFGAGYIIEYITEKFGDPNPGFENDPQYLQEREAHKAVAGRFIAVHKLRTTSRALETILGPEEFKRLQDMWAQGGHRHRWSVAFPIVESYRIVGRPHAKEVLGETAYRRLFAHSSATLRPLNDNERRAIAGLEIEQIPAKNSWIAIEDEILLAERSEIDPRVLRAIEFDLRGVALEGMTTDRWTKVRLRAAWIAQEFVKKRQREGTLFCDDCGFDPTKRTDLKLVRARSLLDVHHKKPLEEGRRRTTVEDFGLLCPTCHRIEHALLKIQDSGKAAGFDERIERDAKSGKLDGLAKQALADYRAGRIHEL
jgi:5-methylcytosine-specific restriction protein A